MSTMELPPEDPAPLVPDETAADADVRDLTTEIETKLGRNGHVFATNRYKGWSDVRVTTPQGFSYHMPIVQDPVE